MIASSGISLLAAGVASGICFLVFSAILKGKSGSSKEERQRIPVDENRCACCLKPFILVRGVRCGDCFARSCRSGCCRWDSTDKSWRCIFCRQHRHWLNKTGLTADSGPIDERDLHRYFNTAKSRVYVAGVENAAASSGLAVARPKEEANAMETVRDFVEKIVEGLIGKVDDAPIDRLYDHPAYNKLLEKHIVPLVDALTRMAVVLRLSLSNKSSADSPTMAHTALREIVERAVEEARKLPGLGSSVETESTREGRDIVDHSYEDLLATAILNKVIEKYQKEQVDGNSNVLHGKPVSTAKCAINESEGGLDEGVEEGCSSLEPLSQDDCSSECSASCSRHPRNQPEPLSLTIEERIEEVTTVYTSDEDPKDNDVLAIRNTHRVPFPELGMDIIDPSQESSEDSQDEPDTLTTHIGLVSPIESWEENWLFQKKRVQTQADPVAMLVPNPSADFKALIGDKDAEDTSDLSECSSAQSDEEIEKELMEAINNVVPRTPTDLEFENGLDNHSEIPGSLSKIETVDQVPPRLFIRPENENKIVEHETKKATNDPKSTPKNAETNEAKEVKEKDEISEKVDEKPVPSSPSDDHPKIQVESRSIAEEFEGTGAKCFENSNNSTNASGSTERKELDQNDPASPSFSKDAETEKNVSRVPITPTCTPRRISESEVGAGSASHVEVFALKDENVLNSLECAKKKLLAVDEDMSNVFGEEEKCGEQRNDYHAEDIQQESEYTEHYDIATQRHLDSLTKTEIPVVENGSTDAEVDRQLPKDEDSRCREAMALAKAGSASRLSLRNEKDERTQLATPPRPGTIAEREHKKWENAPPIENNPYSQENIQKRLWERQYSRRPSDIPGIHTELPKSNGTDLDVVLTPQEPDIKRFGRDYYINDSRAASNEKGRRSAASTSSRPSSSMSQGSSSTGADQEQQEDPQYKETEYLLNKSNDVKSKVAKWQRNNSLENKYESPVRNGEDAHETERKNGDTQRIWEDQKIEEILENERKNSKNEINAKLNNQENYETIETKRTNSDDNQKKIKRIDLKAYGFENEFSLGKSTRTSSPRVVNKLDLKSFGYEVGGIRRTQSNIYLNRIASEDFKPRINDKSNLTRRNDYGNDQNMIESRAAGDNNLAQSSEALNEFEDEAYNGFGLKSAKSVPNIARCYSNDSSNQDDEEVESYNQNSYTELETIKNGSVRSLASTYSLEKSNAKSSVSSVDELENDTDNYSEKNQGQTITNGNKKSLSDEDTDNKVLPLPSVRRLAQAFNRQAEPAAPVSKGNKTTTVNKDRSSTPEIQIVETPRQMHSLTARSLSKQFREGLRQIPNKVTSPPASHVTMEQTNISENQTEVVQGKNEGVASDTNVILPGKLKSNIIFWEQMQRKS
ncbi:uncharacterized protein LOC116426488 isoform X4 [Nomia melanderi]|uniref:uncharacterized protein LOC116426488 isoform X4 n=1 Tax=Nomia melanderi TaxID=2448451 RepID=UPI0013042974|nr:uncharacterized protein LOC116426488 isoform X1 [Nomia melanderi]